MNNYEIATLIVQGTTGAAIVATFVIYFLQLRSMRNSVTCQNLLTVVTFLQSKDPRDARFHVITKLENKKYEDWDEDDRKYASGVCATYDTASIMVLRKLIDKELFFETYGPSFSRCFKIVKPFLDEMRRNAGPLYWGHFFSLGTEALTRSK